MVLTAFILKIAIVLYTALLQMFQKSNNVINSLLCVFNQQQNTQMLPFVQCIFIGDCGVGKTTLLKTATHQRMHRLPTVGVDLISYTCLTQLWKNRSCQFCTPTNKITTKTTYMLRSATKPICQEQRQQSTKRYWLRNTPQYIL